MPYLAVDDFKFGMDRRRERVSGIPGTLWDASNVVISRGGDLRRAKALTPVFTLPDGTVGLGSIREQLFVFGDGATPSGMPAQVQYQRLNPPAAATMVALLDHGEFDRKLYTIAEYDDGNIFHFYNGVRVAEWDTVADGAASDFTLLAEYLALKVGAADGVTAIAVGESVVVSADVPGTAFSISAGTVDNGGTADQQITLTTNQANVVGVTEVRATATLTVSAGFESSKNVVTGVSSGGTPLLLTEVAWTGSNANTAALIAASINANTGTHGYTAAAVSETVTIFAPVGQGAAVNGDGTSVLQETGSTMAIASTAMTGGVTAIAAVAQVVTAAISGTFEPTDQFTITLNGTAYRATPRGAATGTTVYVTKGRVYSAAASVIRYCALNDPTKWIPPSPPTAISAGFISVTSETNSASRIIGIADFDGRTAVFMEDNIAVYSLNADTGNDTIIRVLSNIGTRSARSVVPFSANDVFFFDNSGVRSIRTRSLDGTTRTDDVGTVIDDAIKEFIATQPESAVVGAKGVIEPDDDLFMLLVGDRLWTFSQYPTVKIAAWSYIETPFTPTDIIRTPRRLYVRDASAIYLYGGPAGTDFDDADTAVPFASTPFLAAQDEAGTKMLTGFDIACTGEWRVQLLIDPNDESKKIDLGVYNGVTYPDPDVGIIGESSHFALEFTCVSDGDARISSFALHYEPVKQA